MTEYANILMYAIPGFVILIAIEWFFAWKKEIAVFTIEDTVSSLSSGVTNAIKDVLGLSVIIISYEYFYTHLHIFTIQSSLILYVVGFIAMDFAGYWSHRFEHKVNIFWNRHIIHHSSEEFNLACALRQNISAIFALFTFLLVPAALIGIPPKVIAILAPLHLFAQFWYHTRLINKMGVLESIIVTPSHHRVHHAINDIYLDKNFSPIFIIWDKLFGTFQVELDHEEPIYGVRKAVKTWNPIKINFQHLIRLFGNAMQSKKWSDRIKIWFMPTGWAPEGVINYSEYEETQHQTKYNTNMSMLLKSWAAFQFISTLIIALHLFSSVGELPINQLLAYGGFIFVTIYSYTSLMDKERYYLLFEGIKVIYLLTVLFTIGSWFGASPILICIYALFSLLVHIYFRREVRETPALG